MRIRNTHTLDHVISLEEYNFGVQIDSKWRFKNSFEKKVLNSFNCFYFNPTEYTKRKKNDIEL